MTFQYCFQLAVAATVSIGALSVHAQSTRAAEMDTGSTITSLTSLHSPRHASPPYGAIDASVDDRVTQDAAVAPESTSAEFGNQLQAGRASGHSGLRGSLASQPAPPNSLPGKNLEGMPGTLAVAKASSLQTPFSQSRQDGSPDSLQGPSLQSPQGSSLQALHASAADAMSQGGSIPNAPPASKARGLKLLGDGYSRRDFSGSRRSSSGLSSSRSDRVVLGDASAPSSSSDQSSSDSDPSAADVSPDDADTLNTDASRSESGTTGADRKQARGFFEVIDDPFGELFPNTFEGRRKDLEMERTCGDACVFKKSSFKPEELTSRASESGSSNQQSHRSALEVNGRVPRSRLQRKLGRQLDDAPRSESQAQRRLKDLEQVDRSSSDSVIGMKSSN